MAFTKKEQKQFEKMVRERCSPGGKAVKKWIANVADFLFDLTGDVNLRMSIFNTYEN